MTKKLVRFKEDDEVVVNPKTTRDRLRRLNVNSEFAVTEMLLGYVYKVKMVDRSWVMVTDGRFDWWLKNDMLRYKGEEKC